MIRSRSDVRPRRRLVPLPDLCFFTPRADTPNVPVLALIAGLSLCLVSMHAAETSTNSLRSSVRLPFEFQHGSVIVRARVNATNTELSFKLDTGFGVTTVHPDWV